MATSKDPERIATALGRIPSGLAILTAAHDGRSTGMLASWIQQASFDPLMVSVCVKRDRPIETLIDGSGRFVLNIVGADDKGALKHFGKGFGPDENAFEGQAAAEHESGVILESAIAHVMCTVSAKVAAGDHHLYLGEAQDGAAVAEAQPFVHVRKSAVCY